MRVKKPLTLSPKSPLEVGFAYAKLGWRVLPCHGIDTSASCTCGKSACGSPGKHPATAHGCKDATKNPDEIAALWAKVPEANVGIATGPDSGIWVLDVDGEAGRQSLKALEGQHGKLPATAVVETGGGGLHYYFLWDPKRPVKSRADIGPGTGSKLDVRGAGGYVVAPPSRHASSKLYAWRAGCDPLRGQEVAAAPDWLLKLVRAPKAKSPKIKAHGGAPATLANTAGFADGTRNDGIFALACRYRGKGLSEGEALTLVLQSAAACTPPLTDDEARRCMKSAWTYSPGHPLNDLGNARRLIELAGPEVRYHVELGRWLIYHGGRWQVDTHGTVERVAKQIPDLILAEAMNQADAARQNALRQYARASGNRKAIEGMQHLAQTEIGVPLTADDLDRDPLLLNLENGTLDLRTGKLRPHSRDDLVTRMCRVTWERTAKCLKWQAFLRQVLGGDETLFQYVRRAVGYSLTGVTTSQVFFFLYGTGGNGKSVFLETIQRMMCDYGTTARAETFMARRGVPGIPNDIAALKGARFLAMNETGQGQRLNEPLIKDLTGGDTVTARFLNKEFFTFRPEFKLWIRGNHKPLIVGTDLGIWRRLHLIPFEVAIPQSEMDPNLAAALQQELPGILRWAVDGCQEWRRDGLRPPERVLAAVQRYRGEMDSFADFLTDCVEQQADSRLSAKVFYGQYRAWCEENGESPVSQKRFSLALQERGIQHVHTRTGAAYLGVRLLGDQPRRLRSVP